MVSTEHPGRVRTLELLLLKKYERSEYIINAFDFAFALEMTRAKRVPAFDFAFDFAFSLFLIFLIF